MARVKLSEYRAKHLLFEKLGLKYSGLSINLYDDSTKAIKALPTGQFYVVKVDQAVKKRGLQGLVKIKRSKKEVAQDLISFAKLGFQYALIEPYLAHDKDSEMYLSLSRVADGIRLSFSTAGGINVENKGAITHAFIEPIDNLVSDLPDGLSQELIARLYDVFQETHMTLLEINPLIKKDEVFIPLDAAVEVDSAAQFFVDGAWSEEDVREPKKKVYQAERAVAELNSKSPSSLSLRVLNPDGSIFLLLSGGGASVVVADELAQLGLGGQIANYGEYSGNPTTEETYIYTKEILKLMFKSKARKKVLLIAGGVANFTDVAKTFAGIIRALDESADKLRNQNIKVLVRRGGPNQARGLKAMDEFLAGHNLSRAIYGPEKSLSKIVVEATEVVK